MTAITGRTRDKSEIFRPEALEHRARQRGPGDLIRVAPRWTSWAFYALVAVFAGALVAGFVVDINRYARGPTTVATDGRVVVLLPAALAPQVAAGQPVDVAGTMGEVVSSLPGVLYPPQIARRYGAEVAAPSVAVVTSLEGAAAGEGIARVLIEREPMIVALIPGLDALLGDEDA